MPDCRFCARPLETTLVNLGKMPPANSFLDSEEDIGTETTYPLHARVCDNCLLVQVENVVLPEDLFSDYSYFSSYSSTWVQHARKFVRSTATDLRLGPKSLVIEVGSNDGYLLTHFIGLGVPSLGIDPAANVAKVAMERGIPTEIAFFGTKTAEALQRRGMMADLLVANNVLAHTPELNDFVAGLALLLRPGGVLSLEFPHLLQLLRGVQFDTIYHEHYSYFCLLTAERILSAHGLAIYDVEELPTHGGSLRIWANLSGKGARPTSPQLETLRIAELEAGLGAQTIYAQFAGKVETCRNSVRGFLDGALARGESVIAYGAAAKGNTLLNYCGVTPDEISYVADCSPHKQGKILPGSHIPVVDPSCVRETRPDYLFVLAWNLRDEICEQMSYIRDWGGKFVFPIPETEVVA